MEKKKSSQVTEKKQEEFYGKYLLQNMTNLHNVECSRHSSNIEGWKHFNEQWSVIQIEARADEYAMMFSIFFSFLSFFEIKFVYLWPTENVMMKK